MRTLLLAVLLAGIAELGIILHLRSELATARRDAAFYEAEERAVDADRQVFENALYKCYPPDDPTVFHVYNLHCFGPNGPEPCFAKGDQK